MESANLRVVDSTMPGFRITKQSNAELSADLAERVSDLDPDNTVIVIQLLDNSVFECLTGQGDKILPKRGKDGKYHALGELRVIGKDALRDLFMLMQPVFKAIKGYRGVILSPLPRYIWHRCCENPSHITNSESPSFAKDMGQGLKDLTMNLRNMVFMRKIRGASVLNTVEALGIVPDSEGRSLDIERVLAIWGSDPVHPSPAAYRILSGKIVEKIERLLSDPPSEERPGFTAVPKRKLDPRNPWVSGSQPIAKRAEPTRGIQAHRVPGSRGYHGKRGGFRWHRRGEGGLAGKGSEGKLGFQHNPNSLNRAK
jgi:hypothetical protein